MIRCASVEPPTLPPSTGSGHADGDRQAIPGVVVVFSGGAAMARALLLAPGPLELGRRENGLGIIDDGRVSRRHAVVAFEAGRCIVTDLASQNGTFVDGVRAPPRVATPAYRVIRIGDSLLVPCPDVRPLQSRGVRLIDGFVRGPAMQEVLGDAARAARDGSTLHVRGESGTGKEGIAQAFHGAGARASGDLVTVNCAAIPPAIAERLLFGARRGTYSGADADALGHVQEAHGGTLFLDEIAELGAEVQAKLLRVLESREVVPLGASKPRKVDFALCSATSKDLRALVADGALREDFYFRVGLPAVRLPALRDRLEEIPALIAHELAAMSPARSAHVSLVEQCLLRPWPGNVRELRSEIRTAAAAVADGSRVAARHLAGTAGTLFGGAAAARSSLSDGPHRPDASDLSPGDGRPLHVPRVDATWRRRIEDALRVHEGNVAASARSLGLHRTQLRRLIERHGIVVDGNARARRRDS
jgi:DNA-binding NtrC family response regulator